MKEGCPHLRRLELTKDPRASAMLWDVAGLTRMHAHGGSAPLCPTTLAVTFGPALKATQHLPHPPNMKEKVQTLIYFQK